MNFDDDDLDELVAHGRQVKGYEKPVDEELQVLMAIKDQLDILLAKPQTPIEVKAPVVRVNPPEVVVNPAKSITEWKFTLIKDSNGHTTEIIAKAL